MPRMDSTQCATSERAQGSGGAPVVNPDPEPSDNRACKSVSQGAEADTSALRIAEMAGIDEDELVRRRAEMDAGTRESCCLPTNKTGQ